MEGSVSECRQEWHVTAHYNWVLVGWIVFLVSQPHPAISGEAKAASPARTIVGAIRWNAWFGGNTYQRYLAPANWHTRLPFYSTSRRDGSVEVRSDSQQVMDQEIGYAAAAGLDYWAFCYYHPASWLEADKYNYGWRLYLSSKRKADLRFCILLQGQHLGPKEKWTETMQTFVRLFREPTYQKVCGDRPLVFMYSVAAVREWAGSTRTAKEAILELRQAAARAGVGNPYLVAQVYRPKDGVDSIDSLGFDAISAYSLPGGSGNQEYPFQELAKANRSFWDTCKATGKPVVPIVNVGWDNRPRRGNPAFGDLAGPWFTEPTPAELADHLGSAIRWNKANPHNAPANAVIIYAWNESDEGGWLVPTRSEGAARLNAIAKLLRPPVSQRATAPLSTIR